MGRVPQAVLQSFAMIIFSEIGDKTFRIAAILAMRHPRLLVFAGAFRLSCSHVHSLSRNGSPPTHSHPTKMDANGYIHSLPLFRRENVHGSTADERRE